MTREIAAPAVLDGVTFTFEHAPCVKWCRGWRFIEWNRLAFRDGEPDIEQRVLVCKPHDDGSFSVGEFLESEDFQRKMQMRARGRADYMKRMAEATLRRYAPQLLAALKDVFAHRDDADWKAVKAAIKAATVFKPYT